MLGPADDTEQQWTGTPPQAVSHTPVRRIGFGATTDADLVRTIPVEVPVSIEVGGVAYAVMMATPSDLRDYALGFILSEGLVASAAEVQDLAVVQVEGGWAVRLRLPAERTDIVYERARRRVSESSCGLCGMDNIETVLRPLPPLPARIQTSGPAVARAISALQDHQPLGRETGAVHAAAFCSTDGEIRCIREDVGRHNALDKLVGALAWEGADPASGFFLLSARCSYELVEKTVRAGCPMLVTISAPTSLAVDRAKAAGLTLVSLARHDSALIVCDPGGNIRDA